MRYLLPLVFLVACGSDLPLEPDGCKQNPEIERTESKRFCVDSLRCVKGGEISFSNYLCICDNICICFFSVLTDCKSIREECKGNGSMLLVSNDFCLQPNKRAVLEDLFIETKEIIEEKNNVQE